MRLIPIIMAAGLGLLPSCAPTGGSQETPGRNKTPPEYQATMSLPPSCVLQVDGSGAACEISRTGATAVIAYFDDHTYPFSQMFRPAEKQARERDSGRAAFWENYIRMMALNEQFEGIHNGTQITDLKTTAAPRPLTPDAADICMRNDWSTTILPKKIPVRSREYICIRWIAAADSLQIVEIEVGEIRPVGASAPAVEYQKVADSILASLSFR